MFDNLAKAKAGALYKLLSKLPIEEAAIVLTNLPNQLAIQIIAYYPGGMQTEIGPAMVDARWAEPEKTGLVEAKIRNMLQRAKQNLAAKSTPGALQNNDGDTPAPAGIVNGPPPSPPTPGGLPAMPRRGLVERSRPGTPVARPASAQMNPYQAAAESTPQHTVPAAPQAKSGTEKPTLAARAKELAKSMLSPPLSVAQKRAAESREAEKRPAEKRKNEPPKPWIPRQATASPINGPALPGTPPPVAGDPFASPLAKAGLLDLIGRAQEKLLPKNAQNSAQNTPQAKQSAPPPTRKPGKHGRPDPTEGVLAPGAVHMLKTPRLIGQNAPSKAGARRMDGKAILAAILRESTPDIRGTVRHDDPALFKQLRDRMFYFDDLALTDDNALARVFTAAPVDEASLALKFAAPALRKKVLRAVSPGRAKALEEHAGRAGLDEVEKAQQTVLDVALQLQSAGRILIDPRDPDLAGK